MYTHLIAQYIFIICQIIFAVGNITRFYIIAKFSIVEKQIMTQMEAGKHLCMYVYIIEPCAGLEV